MHYVFLSYINRSGSTFLVNQFSKLNMFCVCPEADVLYNLLLRKPHRIKSFKRKYIDQFLSDKKLLQWRLAPEKVEKILISKIPNGEKFLRILDLYRETYFPSSIYILFKYNIIIQLKSFFEKKHTSNTFQWIYLHRNPLSVYASQKQTISPTTSKIIATNLIEFCQKVNFLESACSKAGTQNLHKIYYEDLILDFNHTYSNLLRFLGVKKPTVKFNSTPGKLRSFMTEEFNSLHHLIDSPPDSRRLNSRVNDLSAYETYYICHKLKLQVPDTKHKNEFRIKFIFPFIGDVIKSYLNIARESVRTILERK